MKTCVVCGSRFEKKSTESARYWAGKRFCSVSCAALGRPPRYLRAGLHLDPREGRYRITCRDGSFVYFYRAVVEAALGRHLLTSEIVHHVNGDPSDDRIENLRIVNRAEHAQLHGRRHDPATGRFA